MQQLTKVRENTALQLLSAYAYVEPAFQTVPLRGEVK